MLPLLDVLFVVVLLHVDLFLQNVEEQYLRSVLRQLQHLQALVEGAHLQLHLVVLHQGDSCSEEVDFALQDEVVPDSQQELVVEAAGEQREEPSYQEHAGFKTDASEMVLHCWDVDLHEIFEELNT